MSQKFILYTFTLYNTCITRATSQKERASIVQKIIQKNAKPSSSTIPNIFL